MGFQRVIPRDLFNESKLLKCLGQVSLLIHDGVPWPLRLKHRRPERGFLIVQDESDGHLCCRNLTLYYRGRKVHLSTVYNSKRPYPLYFTDWDGNEEPALDDAGQWSSEFADWLNRTRSARLA